jgi:hypothetical protein
VTDLPPLSALLGHAGRDPGCDAGLDVIDEYCDTVDRGDPLNDRFAEFVAHLANCAACQEDTEALLAAIRDLKKDERAG